MREEEVKLGRITAIDEKRFVIHFFSGEDGSCFFEDLPYLETGKGYSIGDIIRVKRSKGLLIPMISRPRQEIKKERSKNSRKNKKRELLESFDFSPVRDSLPQQISAELPLLRKNEVQE